MADHGGRPTSHLASMVVQISNRTSQQQEMSNSEIQANRVKEGLHKLSHIPGSLGDCVQVGHCRHAQEIVENALVSYCPWVKVTLCQVEKGNSVTNL